MQQDTDGIDFWQRAQDWWEEKRLAFQEWRTSRDTGGLLSWLAPTLAVLVVVYTLLRFLMRRKKKRASRARPDADRPVYGDWHGSSRWAALLPAIEGTRGKRPEFLPYLAWVRGFGDWPPALRAHAADLVRDHYRRRFGVAGLAATPEDPGLEKAEEIVRQHLGIHGVVPALPGPPGARSVAAPP